MGRLGYRRRSGLVASSFFAFFKPFVDFLGAMWFLLSVDAALRGQLLICKPLANVQNSCRSGASAADSSGCAAETDAGGVRVC
jgi:hypothetical protein